MIETLEKQTLTEIVQSTGLSSVDRESRVIRKVKVLGRHSSNGREYSDQALTKARDIYERMAVNLDHPHDPHTERSVSERFGMLQNLSVVLEGGASDGVYGDLVYLDTHPHAQPVLEMAERMPHLLGLSHNADVEFERQAGGKLYITDIIKARAVDLVTDPGTATSLFESTVAEGCSEDKKEVKEAVGEDPEVSMPPKEKGSSPAAMALAKIKEIVMELELDKEPETTVLEEPKEEPTEEPTEKPDEMIEEPAEEPTETAEEPEAEAPAEDEDEEKKKMKESKDVALLRALDRAAILRKDLSVEQISVLESQADGEAMDAVIATWSPAQKGHRLSGSGTWNAGGGTFEQQLAELRGKK